MRAKARAEKYLKGPRRWRCEVRRAEKKAASSKSREAKWASFPFVEADFMAVKSVFEGIVRVAMREREEGWQAVRAMERVRMLSVGMGAEAMVVGDRSVWGSKRLRFCEGRGEKG